MIIAGKQGAAAENQGGKRLLVDVVAATTNKWIE